MESGPKEIQTGICHERNEQSQDTNETKRKKCHERKADPYPT